ncbi:NUDIX hydrolase [Dictyobacter vulcani]|uniref:NUDIX hydrolase n=1 Tax=Dictyobacter vulcani TaxID=2607529 RepID=UPI0013867999|nr:CoA pyrophosphatase [Dictyobacter vulcani]
MNLSNNVEVIRVLRERLQPVSLAESLVDTIEGQQENARKAAVLLAFFLQDDELHLILIRRASTLRSHSGEIAFPGGKVDATDHSMVTTALREAYEEIGLQPELVEPLGVLNPVFTVVSNYLIMPVVAYLPHGSGNLVLQESEVAELLTVNLTRLADPAITHTEQWTRGNQTRTIHFYDYDQYRIWGATGRIISSLLELLKPASP